MSNNAQDGSLRTVASKSFRTPFAPAARKIDLARNPPPHKFGGVRLDYLTGEFMSRRSAETVVSALQLEIGVADPCIQQPDQRKSIGPRRFADIPEGYPPLVQMHGKHRANIRQKWQRLCRRLGRINREVISWQLRARVMEAQVHRWNSHDTTHNSQRHCGSHP